jgi:hypothetical protein
MKHAALLVVLALSLPALAAQEVLLDRELVYNDNTGRITVSFSGTLDWRNGEMFRKVVVTEKPTDIEAAIQVCVWSGGETCSPCICFRNAGLYYQRHTTSQWWKKNGTDLTGWTSHGTRGYCIKSSCCGAKWLSTCGGSWCMGSSAAPHLPIRMQMTDIFVPNGETFECPEDWEAAPWPECDEPVSARSSAKRLSAGKRLSVENLENGRIKLSAEGARKVALFTTRGRMIATGACDAAGAFVVDTKTLPAAGVIAKVDLADGVQTERIALK